MKKFTLILFIVIYSSFTFDLLGQKSIKDWKTIKKDETLDSYIDSLVYKVLKYNPQDKNSNIENVQITQDSSTKPKIIIRDGHYNNLEPLIILNGHIVENKDIFNKILCSDANEISYLKKERASILYGYRATNGVILITLPKRKFKKVWKKSR